MKNTFKVGVSPDFYVDAKGRFEAVLEDNLGPVEGVEYMPMPPLANKLATPAALDQFDAVFALDPKITPESLKGVRRLAIVARAGVGYNNIDVDALTESDVVLTITPNAVKRPVAEAIFTLILALSKNLTQQDRVVREGKWRGDLPKLGINVKDRVLGSVGCGNIAQEMFRMAQCFGFRGLLACDPYVRQEQVSGLGVRMTDMDTVFRESDYVAVNTLLNKETERLIGERHLRLMKPSAFFINTSRGPIVQHDALVQVLQQGLIAGAGLDVFHTEPLPPGDPILSLPNVIVAPHGLAWTEELMRDNGAEACRNMLAVSRGEFPPGAVNRGVFKRPGFQRKLDRLRSRA